MGNTEDLYQRLEDDVAAVVSPLFELSERQLLENDNFLPHGFVLRDVGPDAFVGAIEDNGSGTSVSTATLPILHEGLRAQVRAGGARAIGVAENVIIDLRDGETTQAIKVLLEHREGLCVAMYLPFERRPDGSYELGSAFAVSAQPEVRPWHVTAQ